MLGGGKRDQLGRSEALVGSEPAVPGSSVRAWFPPEARRHVHEIVADSPKGDRPRDSEVAAAARAAAGSAVTPYPESVGRTPSVGVSLGRAPELLDQIACLLACLAGVAASRMINNRRASTRAGRGSMATIAGGSAEAEDWTACDAR